MEISSFVFVGSIFLFWVIFLIFRIWLYFLDFIVIYLFDFLDGRKNIWECRGVFGWRVVVFRGEFYSWKRCCFMVVCLVAVIRRFFFRSIVFVLMRLFCSFFIYLYFRLYLYIFVLCVEFNRKLFVWNCVCLSGFSCICINRLKMCIFWIDSKFKYFNLRFSFRYLGRFFTFVWERKFLGGGSDDFVYNWIKENAVSVDLLVFWVAVEFSERLWLFRKRSA